MPGDDAGFAGGDAGLSQPDAALPADAGFAPDASADAGSPPDAGAPPDAGIAPDAGFPADAGISPDGGAPLALHFVAMGDTGKANSGQVEVAGAIESWCAQNQCDFVVLLGDNIYDSGVSSVDDQQFQDKFEIPYQNINIPFYLVLGNHDYGGGGAGYEFFKAPYQVEYSSHSTKWRMPGLHYHFTTGNTEFFGLDTNSQLYVSLDANRVQEQKDAIAGWLNASTATWKIAMGHHPYLSNGPHGNAGEYDGLPFIPITNGTGVKNFMEDVVCGKVDLYLCGHDHSRQWLEGTCSGTELAVSGAGASTTELPGDNPARFESNTLGFLYIVIEGNTLTGRFIDTAGNVEFTRTLTK